MKQLRLLLSFLESLFSCTPLFLDVPVCFALCTSLSPRAEALPLASKNKEPERHVHFFLKRITRERRAMFLRFTFISFSLVFFFFSFFFVHSSLLVRPGFLRCVKGRMRREEYKSREMSRLGSFSF